MIRPPSVRGVQHRRADTSWQAILTGYGIVGAVPLALFVLGQPIVGALVLCAVAAMLVGARRGHRLVRCYHDCRSMTLDVPGQARITVRQVPADDTCCR